jgi:cell division septation protein DedD
MIQKSIIILMLSCSGGASFFLDGVEISDSFPFFNSEVQQGPKKKNIVKPKSFYSKRRTESKNSTIENLSFFPVLNDPSLNKIVGLNGQIIKKTNYTPASRRAPRPEKKIEKKLSTPVSSPPVEKAVLKVHVPALSPAKPKKAKVEARPEPSNPISQILKDFPILFPAEDTGANKMRVESKPSPVKKTESIKKAGGPSLGIESFVVQVSSVRQLQRAEDLRSALEKKGYASFIDKIKLPDNKGTWYRVNIGSYLDHAGAETAAAKYFREENRKAMVIRHSG